MIFLYERNETTFDTNGLGPLPDATSCVIKEELNGQFELELNYPMSGLHYSDIASDRIILAKPNPNDNPQPFRIYDISKPLNGIVTINARHISYDLSGIISSYFEGDSPVDLLANMKLESIIECPFSFETDIYTVLEEKLEVLPTTMRNFLSGQFKDKFECDFKYDLLTVHALTKRGENRGVSISYGKNLTDLKDQVKSTGYNAIYPFYYNKFTGVKELPEKYLVAPGTHNVIRIYPYDLTTEAGGIPTDDFLREKANEYMTENKFGELDSTIEISFVSLEQSEEYSKYALLEKIELGDTVKVRHLELGVDKEARCVSTTYNVLTNRFVKMELGKIETTIADTISYNNNIVKEAPTKDFVGKIIKENVEFEARRATAAEEELSGRITTNYDKISLVVESGTSKSDLVLTDEAIKLATKNISLETVNEGFSGEVSIDKPIDYGFTYETDTGYYKNDNWVNDKSGTIAVARISFYVTSPCILELDCKQLRPFYEYESDDYGLIGKPNVDLTKSRYNTSDEIYESFDDRVRSSERKVIIPFYETGNQFIDVKFIRGWYTDTEDFPTFEFKIDTSTKNVSYLEIKNGTTYISSAKIEFKGLVSFTDLLSTGKSTINGSNIKTGTIESNNYSETYGTGMRLSMNSGSIETGSKRFSLSSSGDLKAHGADIAGEISAERLAGSNLDISGESKFNSNVNAFTMNLNNLKSNGESAPNGATSTITATATVDTEDLSALYNNRVRVTVTVEISNLTQWRKSTGAQLSVYLVSRKIAPTITYRDPFVLYVPSDISSSWSNIVGTNKYTYTTEATFAGMSFLGVSTSNTATTGTASLTTVISTSTSTQDTVKCVTVHDSIVPKTTNDVLLGTTSRYFKEAYIHNVVTTASARVYKTDISDFNEKHEVLFDNLKPRTYKFKESDSNRTHYGFILDEFRDALDTSGLNTDECAAYVLSDKNEPNGTGGIRYSELIPLLVNEVQKLKQKINELENNRTEEI